MKKATFIIIALLCLSVAVPVSADQFGLGGTWVDGHSDSGNYGINNKGDQSWGLHLNYDKDLGWHKNTKYLTFGLDPSMQLFYLHWTKTVNGEETKCEKGEWQEPRYDTLETNCYFECPEPECTTKSTYKNQTVHSLIAGVGPKGYIEYKRYRLYGLVAPAYALQDGAQDDFTIMAQAGLSVQFTQHFGMSLDHTEIFVNPTGKYDRFDATSLNAVLFF